MHSLPRCCGWNSQSLAPPTMVRSFAVRTVRVIGSRRGTNYAVPENSSRNNIIDQTSPTLSFSHRRFLYEDLIAYLETARTPAGVARICTPTVEVANIMMPTCLIEPNINPAARRLVFSIVIMIWIVFFPQSPGPIRPTIIGPRNSECESFFISSRWIRERCWIVTRVLIKI